MNKKEKSEEILEIFPQISYGSELLIRILGNKKGLKFLAEQLLEVAEFNPQSDNSIPDGERYHKHLNLRLQKEHSVDVEICQAEAKGTKELPSFL